MGGDGRKETVETLREHDALLRAIVQTAVDGIVTIDERGVIESINPAAERLFGYTAEEAVGKNVKIFLPTPFREEHDDHLANYLATGEKKIIGIGREVIGQRKDGSTFPLQLSVSEGKFGKRRFFTGIVHDLTTLRQAQQRVLQSERLATIGQMVTAISHESRNALQRIQAGVEMLELELEDHAEALSDTARIQKACDDLRALLDEVRGYAAPIKLDRSVCCVAGIWRRAWSRLGPLHEHRQAVLRDQTDGVDARCLVDDFRMEQVFRNLFENSLAACPDPMRVDIDCSQAKLAEREALHIAVHDSGPGLTDEQKRKVFDAFYTTKSKGTGLGMSIAKRIVEAHGGRIAVADDQKKGVQFLIALPRDSGYQAS